MYSPFRHLYSILHKGNPIHLTFFVTRRCNLRCSYCFYLSRDKQDTASELSIDEIEKVSSSIKNLLWLAFSGGEIFLRDDIVEITRIFYERNKPSIILFSTNGILTDTIERDIGSILKYCKKSTVVVKLSLEGLEEVNDRIRGDGCFKKTIETYKRLRRFIREYPNFELGINTVFCKENQDHMDELIEYVKGLNDIKTHTVSLIRGSVFNGRLKDIDTGRYLKTIERMESLLRNKEASIYRFRGSRLKAAQDILQRRIIYNTLIQQRQLIPCYAGRINIVLTETGDLYPCESFDMRLGNVRENDYDISKVLKMQEARKTIESIKKNGCYCTHECYLMTNILFNPRMYPSLIKEYLRL
jgi:radical SAM protein with 4Fe4S-binding SPASM domain